MSQSESHGKYEDLIEQCDALIKAGKVSSVITILSKQNLARVPRPFRQGLAKICRRAGAIELGLRVLQPIIRYERELETPPNSGEICEYAVLLSRNGSNQEALNLLKEVDANQAPEAMLYQGYCHISNWDYSASISYFEKFLVSSAEPYSKLIARVNLAASYLTVGNSASAELLLGESIALAQQAGASRLIGNCLELRGQMHFLNGDFVRSREDLSNALKIFGHGQSYDQLLVYKWQCAMQSQESKSLDPILEFRSEALRRKHWESVREADLFAVKIVFDQSRFDHLIFGTPLAAYRSRVMKTVGRPPSERYILGSKGSCLLNLETGQFQGKGDLKPGKKIHQAIAALTKDFYVPRNMGALFSDLYPEEHFDINSSPSRVRQILKRARIWLQENNLPASIEQAHGAYRFLVHGDVEQGTFGLLIPLNREAIEPNPTKWKEIIEHFPINRKFSIREACEKLHLSRSSFHRLSNWAVEMGLLKRIGAGRSTLYQLKALDDSQDEPQKPKLAA